MIATAEARANIALVKYWGKRDTFLNLPAAGSISLTLDRLITRTTVEFVGNDDQVFINEERQADAGKERVVRILDLVRARVGTETGAIVRSTNTFPTASGLASSSSGFAALALAASSAAGLKLDPRELSVLARRGSGSAARSIFGGFVEMQVGCANDGSDACAVQLLPESAWDLCMIVATVGGGTRKSISSTTGMMQTADTSPFYPSFVRCIPADLADARQALQARDLHALGEVTERSAFMMHATALAARPQVLYFRGPTVEAIHAIRGLRAEGTAAFVTIDAGPHVKVLCDPVAEMQVKSVLAQIPGVTAVQVCKPGPGVRLV